MTTTHFRKHFRVKNKVKKIYRKKQRESRVNKKQYSGEKILKKRRFMKQHLENKNLLEFKTIATEV